MNSTIYLILGLAAILLFVGVQTGNIDIGSFEMSTVSSIKVDCTPASCLIGYTDEGISCNDEKQCVRTCESDFAIANQVCQVKLCGSDYACGYNTIESGNYCGVSGDVVYNSRVYSCMNQAKENSYCKSEIQQQLFEDCQGTQTCANAKCKNTCNADSDCGTVITSAPYCSGNNAVKKITTPTCGSAATIDSYCKQNITIVTVDSCSTNEVCYNGACVGANVCGNGIKEGTEFCDSNVLPCGSGQIGSIICKSDCSGYDRTDCR
jgi:hypothetical protein